MNHDSLFEELLKDKNDKLPHYSVQEFNEKVQSGCQYVVVKGMVVDLKGWINAHPGGARLLRQSIGTDISNALAGRGDVQRKHRHSSAALGNSPHCHCSQSAPPAGDQTTKISKASQPC